MAEQLRLVLAHVAWVSLTMGALYLLTPKPLPLIKAKGSDVPKPANVLEFVHTVWWYPFVFVLVSYAARATAKLGSGGAGSRWTQTCDESFIFLRLYVSAQLVAIPVECSQPQPLGKKLQMVGHHIVSIIGYVFGLWTQQCHFFGTAAGLSEVSTIFLEGMLLSKHVVLEPYFTKFAPWFLPFNGACLWLSFIVFRLTLFPALIAVYMYDALANTEATWAAVGPVKFCVGPMLVFLFVLSASWFTKIHAGFIAKILNRSRKHD